MTASTAPEAAYAAALAGLPGIGPVGLVGLLRRHRPEEAWRRVQTGQECRPAPAQGSAAGQRRTSWAAAAAGVDPTRLWERLRADGIGVTFLGEPDFPEALRQDPEPPGVLFRLGDLGALDNPCVAIVGTRQCTSYGRAIAAQLGCDLADAGVCVVSGLALGIDGAAHAGALEAGPAAAGPVGVAASGVDRPYPRRHTELWARVAAAGAVISETAPGQPAQSWRFPARNRIIAGLCRAVVVVESHTAGGSMLTVGAAADRGIEVLAVPGPVTSSSSAGTNQLLSEGLAPVRHAGDVLAALGDLRPWPPRPPSDKRERAPGGRSRGDPGQSGELTGCDGALAGERSRGRPVPPRQGRLVAVGGPKRSPRAAAEAMLDRPSRRVLTSVGWTPTSTGVVADRTGVPVGSLAAILVHLESLGLIRGAGGWWERCRV